MLRLRSGAPPRCWCWTALCAPPPPPTTSTSGATAATPAEPSSGEPSRGWRRLTWSAGEFLHSICTASTHYLHTYTVSAHCQHIIYLQNIYTRGIQDRNRGLRGLRDLQVLLCLQVREVSASGHEERALAGFFYTTDIIIY